MTLSEMSSGRPNAPSAETAERLLTINIPAQPDRLRLVRAAVAEAAQASGCSEECVRDIVLAVDEACQNIIKHGYGGDPTMEICLNVARRPDSMVVEVVDFAEPVDASKIKPRRLDDLRPGGLGTHFIQSCMDETEFSTPPQGAGNLLRMVKRIS